MRGKGYKVIAFLLAAVLAGGALVNLLGPLERMFVFFPTRELEATPADAGLEYEEVFFETDKGVRLHGWHLPGPREITWVFFHGNGGNIGHRVEEMAITHRRLGVKQFIFDYRGYGRSGGQASVENTHRDARAALEYLRSREDYSQDKAVYFGRSLGAAVAVDAAAEFPPLGLVLVAPFTSLRDMAKVTPSVLPFAALLAGDRYDSLALMPRINAPTLMMHGEHDEMVPLEFGRRLFEAANHPKKFVALPNTEHNDTYEAGGELFWRSLEDFLGSLEQR